MLLSHFHGEEHGGSSEETPAVVAAPVAKKAEKSEAKPGASKAKNGEPKKEDVASDNQEAD